MLRMFRDLMAATHKEPAMMDVAASLVRSYIGQRAER